MIGSIGVASGEGKEHQAHSTSGRGKDPVRVGGRGVVD